MQERLSYAPIISLVLGVLLACLSLSNSAFADVRLVKPEKSNPYIYIEGEIVVGDYSDFVDAAHQAYQEDITGSLFVRISSPGGNMNEAMLIGTAIRKLRLSLSTLEPESKCYSACLFILSGSVSPTAPGGVIGIHRPRFDSTYFSGLSSAEAFEKYRKLLKITKSYLRSMGVRTELIELMYQIPSSELRILTVREVDEYGLSDLDPSYDEWLTANCGAMTEAETEDYWYYRLYPDRSKISKGYATFLANKTKKVEGCRGGAAWRDRKQAAARFFSFH